MRPLTDRTHCWNEIPPGGAPHPLSLAGGAGARVAVGTGITLRPPHRSRRGAVKPPGLASGVYEGTVVGAPGQGGAGGPGGVRTSSHPAPRHAPAAPLAATP